MSLRARERLSPITLPHTLAPLRSSCASQIGSNIGFYTLLFATRGYDVVSIEPLEGAAVRQLHSLESAHVAVASTPGAGVAEQIAPFASLEVEQAAGWAARDEKAGFGGAPKKGRLAQALSKKAAKAAPAVPGVRTVAGGGRDSGGDGDGSTRASTAWVYVNGAADAVNYRELVAMDGNPGASFITLEGETKEGSVKIVTGAFVQRQQWRRCERVTT